MLWTDPSVQSAVIQSAGNLIATVIAAICAAIIGKQFNDRKKLQEKLLHAQRDIAFMLAVEEAHCELHMKRSKESFKNRMRSSASNAGHSWSGKFTPGRVKDF